MSKKDKEKNMTPEELVNKSGFPLQIALENEIGREEGHDKWWVIHSEHEWSNDKGESGFIDLVLELGKSGTFVLVVECKRVLDADWLFFNSKGTMAGQKRAKGWLTEYGHQLNKPRIIKFDWTDFMPEPSSPECEYAITRGEDGKNTPMLERVAATLVASTEAFAHEEKPLFPKRFDRRLYFNVIVTTAKLKVCTFDPGTISLADGTLKADDFTEVGFIRFRKQLQHRLADPADFSEDWSSDVFYQRISAAKENTVFVVNAEKFSAFLKKFDPHKLQHAPA
jgi:hypothetical protein